MIPSYPTIVTSRRVVSNQQPLLDPGQNRIAIVGDCPDEHSENYGIPFVGASGQLLDIALHSVGINRQRCFVGHVCRVRPPGNEITRFPWNGEEVQSGLATLRADLTQFSPHIILLLGDAPLRAAGQMGKAAQWRGSLFTSSLLLGQPVKCIASIHPNVVLREFSPWHKLLTLDLLRVQRESSAATLSLPQRELATNLSAGELCYLLDSWPSGVRCSLDIEGGLSHGFKGWPCVSLSGSPLRSTTIAWMRLDKDGHARVLSSFTKLMGRVDVPKVLQNSLYDNFVLSHGYGILIRNVAEDTMLKGWEVYCELPKSLSCQASIWTRQPHWKDDSMYAGTGEGLFRGCALDSAVTLEICEAQDGALQPTQYAHYRSNVSLLNVLHYLEHRGIKYDIEGAAKRAVDVLYELHVLGNELQEIAGHDLRGKKGSLSSQRLAYCLYQLPPGTTPKGKPKSIIAWKNSSFPPQWKKEFGRNTTKTTTDVVALLNLRKKCPDPFLDKILRHRYLEKVLVSLSWVPDLDGRMKFSFNQFSKGGDNEESESGGGNTETGRLRCSSSLIEIDGKTVGGNGQTVSKKERSLYVADPGYDFFQCDLEGADGWTVATHCARLGDRTMLDDYYAGIKPAKVIGLLYFFGAKINDLDRASLKHACDVIFPIVLALVGKWLYDGCKVVQHGSNYMMGIPTMILNLIKQSYKKSGEAVYLDHATASQLQHLYFLRYPGVKTWHTWGESQLRAHGELLSASGQLRQFFGRRFGKDIHDTVKELLAHEPQSNTTWATNLAMLRLWNDPANRLNRIWDNPANGNRTLMCCAGSSHVIASQNVPFVSHLKRGSLLVEPLHQVHDAVCGQWPQCLRDWARGKVKEWFQNELEIAGTKLIIPFDGAFGPSWGEQPNRL